MKKYLLLLLLISMNACRESRPSAANETKRAAIDSTEVNPSAQSDDGIIYLSHDNGATWQNTSDGLPEKISIGLGAVAVSSTTAAVVTKESGIYFFDLHQNRWTNVSTDEQIINSNPDELLFYKNEIYVGSQHGGVFFSHDNGTTWATRNNGLGSLTIRRLIEIDNILYAGTNDGVYAYNNALDKWELRYGPSTLQVNGITEAGAALYIATNQGVFTSRKNKNDWKQVLANHSLHNIAAFGTTLYAMTYNELLTSADQGHSWQNIQKGLPRDLYTFNVIKNHTTLMAAQWDGVYRKEIADKEWRHSSKGLPAKFAATNFKSFNGILIISGAERKLTKGLTAEK